MMEPENPAAHFVLAQATTATLVAQKRKFEAFKAKYFPDDEERRYEDPGWAAIADSHIEAVHQLAPNSKLAARSGEFMSTIDSHAAEIELEDVRIEQALQELEAAELRSNDEFSPTVPHGTTTYDATMKGFDASQNHFNTYDDESYEFLQSAIAWFRWAALQGDVTAAFQLGDSYRRMVDGYSFTDQLRPDYKLDGRCR